jgi:hypothetical protein
MNRIVIAFIGTSLALLPACGAAEEPSTEGMDSAEQPPIAGEQTTAEPTGETAEGVGVSCGEPDECGRMGEQIGEAQQATAAGNACVAACAVSYAALCHRVRVICAVAEVVTVGEATIPCATALGVACIGGAGLGAICARQCPP